MENKTKVFIGFIIFGEYTAKYLSTFLLSLKNQTYKNFKIIVFNNGVSNDASAEYLKNNYPEIEIISAGNNLGFSAGYNQLISKAIIEQGDYFFMTNPDMVYEDDVLEKLVNGLEQNEKLSSVCPKIFRWDFTSNIKTDIIDTCGLGLKSGLHFFDLGQGEKDNEKFSSSQFIFGPGGASALFRLSALQATVENGKFLDDRMFMYKEDCDLAYRLHQANYDCFFIPEAHGWHDRTAAKRKGIFGVFASRKSRSRDILRWSLINQELLFKKYWKSENFISKLNIVLFEFKALVFILIFERFLLKDLMIFKRG